MKYCGGEHGVIIAVKTRQSLSLSLLLSSIKHQLIYERPDRKEGRKGEVKFLMDLCRSVVFTLLDDKIGNFGQFVCQACHM